MPVGINRHWEQHQRGGCGSFIFAAPIPGATSRGFQNSGIPGTHHFEPQDYGRPGILVFRNPYMRSSHNSRIPEYQVTRISKLQNSRTPEFQNYRITGLRNCVIMELHRKHHERGVRYSRIFEGVRLPFATRWGDP